MLKINTTCNATLDDLRIGASEVPLIGNITFHNLGLIIAAACSLIAILLSFYLMWMHALHYTNPNQQRHIIRILFMIPIYATASFLGFWFYWHAIYFQVISECYEAFAIASFFALLCHYIAPNLHDQKTYFRGIQARPWVLPVSWFARCCGGERGPWRTPRSGLTWFNIIWTGVYQYCFIRVSMTITAVVTQYFGKYCESSNSPVFGHIWILVIEGVSVSIAMYCLIQFYLQLRHDLAHHSPFLKVLAIKLVIFLSFWQSFLISILTSSTLKIVRPTDKISYPDLKVGIPSLLLCIEMMIFAFLHLFAFPYRPYSKGAPPAKFPISTPSINSGMVGPGPNQGGFLGIKAFVDAMNPWDLVKAFARGMKWLFVGRKSREEDSSYKNSAFNFGNADENGVTLGEAGGANGGYKQDSGYNGAMGLPIADQFRRSNFGMPSMTPQDEEGAGLIAHAQPNPLNSGNPTYAHPGQPYNYGQQINPPYPDSSNQRQNYGGQDIVTGGGRYGLGQEHSSSYGKAPGRPVRDEIPYGQGQGQKYRPDNQSADIGMAIGGESEPYRSHVPGQQAYGNQGQTRPSTQWKNSSRPTTPPARENESFFPGREDGNVI